MKTDDLIAMLANDADAVAPQVWRQRYLMAMSAGLAGAVLLMLSLLGIRPDIAAAAQQQLPGGTEGAARKPDGVVGKGRDGRDEQGAGSGGEQTGEEGASGQSHVKSRNRR